MMPLVDPTQAFIKEMLDGHITAKYKADHNKSICAPGTRKDLLADIEKWLSPQPSNAELIFWVTGIPGSGKSTLSATIVENLRKNHTPVSAQYFISRNIPETMDPNKIIPTIARQLAISSPIAARVLKKALEDGYPATRAEQVTSLLLDPIRELSKSRDMVVILIDALDELNDAADSAMEILSRIAPIDSACDLPNNIKFIITSRPEHWTSISGFNDALFKHHSLATKSSVTEVNNFVVARMSEITPDGSEWHGWPNDDQLQMLFDKANGLFHYAATALRWIKEQIRKNGTACQKTVFERFSEDGLDELNGLYELILTSWEDVYKPTKDNHERATRLSGFQHVMGTILMLRKPLLIKEIVELLSDIPKDEFDVKLFLEQMRSVLIPGATPSSDDSATPQIHKSFRDYIMSEHAPREFRILTKGAHFMIARSCFHSIVKAESQRGNGNEYAVTNWHRHLHEAEARCDDERMWTLLSEMMNQGVVGVGTKTYWNWTHTFACVASTGWKLLKVRQK